MSGSVHQKFSAALDRVVEQIKEDRSILAAIRCGSLSHDTVRVKPDIDLVLVTAEDRKAGRSDIALYADGIAVHALLMPHETFRATVEGTVFNPVVHPLLAQGRLLYAHDPSIARLCTHLGALGDRDMQVQLFKAGATALACLTRAHRWFVGRADLDHTALWILHAATPLARIEIISRGLPADREAVPQAAALRPELFAAIYTGMLDSRKTTSNVHAALDAADAYIAERADLLFAPVLEYLEDAGEARTAADIENHLARQFDLGGATTVCEYLAAQGRIGRTSIAARLTAGSSAEVQELAFFPMPPARG